MVKEAAASEVGAYGSDTRVKSGLVYTQRLQFTRGYDFVMIF